MATSATSAALEELCKQVAEARAKRDELKAQLDNTNAELGSFEAKLADLMIKEDNQKVSAAGFNFSTAIKVGWKVISDNRDQLVTILKTGAPELVKETVNASSLSSFLRKNEESLESDNPQWWTKAKECMTRDESPTLSVRKSTKKKK